MDVCEKLEKIAKMRIILVLVIKKHAKIRQTLIKLCHFEVSACFSKKLKKVELLKKSTKRRGVKERWDRKWVKAV